MKAPCPSEKAVDIDIASVRFQTGVARKQWRVILYAFPVLIMVVAAIEPDGRKSEYYFRFELSGFKATAPEVMLWDLETNSFLPEGKRPKGSRRVMEAFKIWGEHKTVYRPWERTGMTHGNWATTHPELIWHSKRDLAFILEDLHGLLTSNAALVLQPA